MAKEQLSEKEIEKIKQNEEEDTRFREELERLLGGSAAMVSRPLRIGVTPNVLVICGAQENRGVTITKRVINKAMRPEIRDKNGRLTGRTGHGITKDQLVEALTGIKCPWMVFRGKRERTLLIITSVLDGMDRNLAVAVDLDRQEGFEIVSSVRSIHGREHLMRFMIENICEGRLLAVNKEKTDEMLHSIEKRYLKENTPVSFDKTIAYSLKNVKQLLFIPDGAGEK